MSYQECDYCYKQCGTVCSSQCGAECNGRCDQGCMEGCHWECIGYCEKGCHDSCYSMCDGACGDTCSNDCGRNNAPGCNNICTGECTSCRTTCAVMCSETCDTVCSSCQSGCGTECQKACSQGCGTGCTGTCKGGCQGSCEGKCEGCTDVCQGSCELTCSQCTNECGNGCDSDCDTGCYESCQTTCQNYCGSSCEGYCSQECAVTCGTNCAGSCGTGCSKSCTFTCSEVCSASCANSGFASVYSYIKNEFDILIKAFDFNQLLLLLDNELLRRNKNFVNRKDAVQKELILKEKLTNLIENVKQIDENFSFNNNLIIYLIKNYDISNISQIVTDAYEETVDTSQQKIYTMTINVYDGRGTAATPCFYMDDAIGKTAGSTTVSTGSTGWEAQPIFKDIKPCVFKEGQVQYYLNKTNFSKKEDNTNADLTGEDGDVMIEFPKCYYKLTNDNNYLTISITNNLNYALKNNYSLDAFSRKSLGDIDHFYIGAFLGYKDENNKLRSIIGKQPLKEQTIETFRTYAQNNGEHYQIMRFSQLTLIQALMLIRAKQMNVCQKFGKGVSSKPNIEATFLTGYNHATTASTSYATWNGAGKGLFIAPSSTSHIKMFGIEDFWGHLEEFVDGCYIDFSHIYTSWNLNNNEGIASNVYTIDNYPRRKRGWLRKVQGSNAGGFLPLSLDSTSNTNWSYDNRGIYPTYHWGDYCSFYIGDDVISYNIAFGGDLIDVDQQGPFSWYAKEPDDTSYTCARLCYI